MTNPAGDDGEARHDDGREIGSDDDPALEALLEFVKRSRGLDFTGYKRPTLQRRIAKRMVEVHCGSYADYQDYLDVRPEEYANFFDTLLINVTGFFRDPPAWQFLADEIVPRILSGKERGSPIRVWSAGCASGEEAYTLAMVLADALGTEQFRDRVKIYGTDVDEDALTHARQATFTAKDLEAVPPAFVDTYFESMDGAGLTFRKDLRRAVIFGRHDLLQDAPISRLDLLVCRNTLMYFNSEFQSGVLDRFHFALREGGFLFLGKAETLLTQSALFLPVELRLRIFQRAEEVNSRARVSVAASRFDGDALSERASLKSTLRDAAIDESPLPLLVVDVNGALAVVNGPARRLFGLTGHNLGSLLQDLEVSYRPVDLRTIIDEAYAQRDVARRRGVQWSSADGDRFFDVEVAPCSDNTGNIVGAAVTFVDVTQQRQLQAELEYSNRELETAYEELQSTNEELETTNEKLQSTIEELETTNEKLQSTIEELETTNEELQSTIEELETMNEELQSTNDELQYVNEETERRGVELGKLNRFFAAITTSLEQAVVVLDRQVLVEVWNDRCRELWGLRSDEVVGQSFLGLDIGLPVDQLWAPIRQCLDGSAEATVTVAAHDRRGRGITCRVRCRAFQPEENTPKGVVMVIEVVDTDG